MSFEAIYNISQAETEGKAAVAAAEAKARQLIAEAEAAGKASVEEAVARADKELELLYVKAGEKNSADAEALARELEDQKAALLAKAQEKLDSAASLVVERIVNN